MRPIEVRYEDLVFGAEATPSEICKLAGVAFHPSLFDCATASTSSKPRPPLGSQWKRKPSDMQVRLAEARIGSMLVERSYELSGFPRLEVTGTMERLRRPHRCHLVLRLSAVVQRNLE